MDWIDAKKEPPRRDIPILILSEYCPFPISVYWKEEVTYGKPGFFEENDECVMLEEYILFWMPLPEAPNFRQNTLLYPLCCNFRKSMDDINKNFDIIKTFMIAQNALNESFIDGFKRELSNLEPQKCKACEGLGLETHYQS